MVLTICLTVLASGCALNPSSLGAGLQSIGNDGTRLHLRFADTLNLPAGAFAKLNGTQVGRVQSVKLHGQQVDVDVALDNGVRIPANATGSIRQDTILGDPYIYLTGQTTPGAGGQYLPDGGTIPLDRTSSPPPLEDTLAVLANFVNGGSIQNMQNMVRAVNTATPDLRQTRRVAQIAARDMDDLASATDTLDEMLSVLGSTTDVLVPRTGDIKQMFSPAGVKLWTSFGNIGEQLGILLPSVGSIFEGGFWLVPMLNSVNGSFGVVYDGIHAVASNEDRINSFLSDNLFPFIQKPSFNIVSVRSAEGQNMLGMQQKLLRMLGAIQ